MGLVYQYYSVVVAPDYQRSRRQCAELSAELQQMRTEWQSEGGQLREEVTRLTSEY